jgi:hypothetical protein
VRSEVNAEKTVALVGQRLVGCEGLVVRVREVDLRERVNAVVVVARGCASQQ